MQNKVNFLRYNVVLLDLVCIFVETNKETRNYGSNNRKTKKNGKFEFTTAGLF